MVEFDPDRRWAGIENAGDPITEIGGNVRGAGRADAAGAIGARRGQRQAGGGEQLLRNRVRRHPDRDRIEAGRDKVREATVGPLRHDHGQRTRPEGFRQFYRHRGELGDAVSRLKARDMHDQGIEARAALGAENASDGGPAGRIGGEAVDCLRRHGDKPAGAQRRDRRGKSLPPACIIRHIENVRQIRLIRAIGSPP